MIVSASYRTDIPAFYGAWFANRFRAGYAMVANPYGGKPCRVALRDDVDGYVFWTRNAGPFLPALAMVRDAGLPFVIQYTVTNYPRPLETSVMAAERSVALIRRLADDHGRRAVVWRYDPILVSDLTPPAWHVRTFATLAGQLAGAVDEVVVSFAQIYRKTARNLAAAARAHHFAWRDPEPAEKREAITSFAAIAGRFGMRLTLCTQPGLLSDMADAGVGPAACVDAARLADVAGRPISARRKGNRPGCLCDESRDIGAYDTCPHGCVYCYAVASRSLAQRRRRSHDPQGEFLVAGD